MLFVKLPTSDAIIVVFSEKGQLGHSRSVLGRPILISIYSKPCIKTLNLVATIDTILQWCFYRYRPDRVLVFLTWLLSLGVLNLNPNLLGDRNFGSGFGWFWQVRFGKNFFEIFLAFNIVCRQIELKNSWCFLIKIEIIFDYGLWHTELKVRKLKIH